MTTPAEDELRFFKLPMDMLCIAGFDGYFKRINDTWERVLGWSRAEILRAPYMDFVHPEDRDSTTAAASQQSQEGKTVFSFQNRYRCKDGSYRWLHWNSVPFAAEQLMYASARDITEYKHTEERLNQAQKLEAIGRLAGGIAHDFNNLLTVILGRGEMALSRKGLDPALARDLGLIQSAGQKASGLTRQLLQFSRQQVLRPNVVDINAIVTELEPMLRRLLPESIAIVVHLDPDVGRINADASQLEQVVLNLALNARDAMESGGRLTIETTTAMLGTEYQRTHAESLPGTHVLLAVTDTGHGMDAATRARIFEPFFTTKELGKGTGLGLATVYGIVKQSGGNIWVYSEPGHGTIFKVYLPTVKGLAAADAAPAAAAPAAGRGTETVLVVEDETAIAELTRDVLSDLGYRVILSGDFDEALLRAREHAGEIHLLLTDVVLPRGTAQDLIPALSSRWPGMKVLYMSGYTSHTIVQNGVLDPGKNFLQKPFMPSVLAAKVREVLAQPAGLNTQSEAS